MGQSTRAFRRYQARYVPVAGVLAGLTPLVALLVAVLAAAVAGPVIGTVVGLATAVALIDQVLLVGNGWLRRQVAAKLRACGELSGVEGYRFVGLAHPCHNDTVRRRMIETDDDVGFLRCDWSGLHFRGDGLSFDIPAARIEDVSLARSVYAPWGRVKVTIGGGEPLDEVIFDSRDRSGHTACRADNRQLYDQLRGLMLLNAPAERLRLTGETPVGSAVRVGD